VKFCASQTIYALSARFLEKILHGGKHILKKCFLFI
jgi:hypothetical protein